uniref:Uncharacterized protein n=1 Tax=Anguilla anguilla TaxID=7936 RepID=A0A0E9VVK6_ANGAN
MPKAHPALFSHSELKPLSWEIITINFLKIHPSN